MKYGIWNSSAKRWAQDRDVRAKAESTDKLEFIDQEQAETWYAQYEQTWDIDPYRAVSHSSRIT